MLHDFRQSIAFWKVSWLPPVCSSGKSNMKIEVSVKHWWNDSDWAKQI